MAKPPIPLPPKKHEIPKHHIPPAPMHHDMSMPLAPPPAPLHHPPMPPAPRPSTSNHFPKPPSREIQQPKFKGKGPPLFIKIDKYGEVVNNLYKLKTYSLGLRDALDVLADVEKELQHGLSITHKALDKFNSTISTLDIKITRISPSDVEDADLDTEEMDEYVKRLHEQMERIREELKSITF